MIRVLGFSGPEDARRRIGFHGVARDEADRLVSSLRALLLGIPLGDPSCGPLAGVLERRGVPHARGTRHLLLTVSSREEIAGWMAGEPESAPFLAPLAEALSRPRADAFRVPCRDRILDLAGPPRLMGILNVTPDSFSDGGVFRTADEAVRRGLEMAEEGAAVIDVGGESTRPGSSPVSEAEELSRVLPVVRGLAGQTDALISVDTTKAAVARAAADAGARIVNDTSALGDDAGMSSVVRETGCAVVLMHRKGRPATMQDDPRYASLLDEVIDGLAARIAAARAAGIPEDRILVDPGIGFGKRVEDNLALHRRLADLAVLSRPVVLGSSRKSFIGAVTGRPTGGRAFGTAAAVAAGVLAGAHLLRVHDVAAMADAVRVADAVARGPEC